jgi:hypothetical protein
MISSYTSHENFDQAYNASLSDVLGGLQGITWSLVKNTMAFTITAPLFIASNTVALLSPSTTPMYQYLESWRFRAIHKLDVLFNSFENMISSDKQTEANTKRYQEITPEPYLPLESEVMFFTERLELIIMQVSVVYNTFVRLIDPIDSSITDSLRHYVTKHKTQIHKKTCVMLISEYFEGIKNNDVGVHVSKEHEVAHLLKIYNVHVASYSSLDDISKEIDRAKNEWTDSDVDLVCLVGEGSPGYMQINSKNNANPSCLMTQKSFNNTISKHHSNNDGTTVQNCIDQLKRSKTVGFFGDHPHLFDKMTSNGKIILNWCCAANEENSFVREMKRYFPKKKIYGHRDIISEMFVKEHNGDLSVMFSSHYGCGYKV